MKLKFNWKIAIPILAVVVVAAVVCLFLLLRGGGDEAKKPEALPEAYAIGSVAIPALASEEEITWTENGDGDYTYEGFESAGSAAEGYVNDLLEANLGFFVVDETYTKADAPDFTAEEGTVIMARAGENEGELFSVTAAWSANNCHIQIAVTEGTISEKPVESVEPEEGMTLSEAVNRFKTLDPADLRLEGTSMDEYLVYPLSGTVMVDGEPCLRINVCSVSTEDTNDTEGIYFVSADGESIYYFHKDTNTVEKLEF